VRYIFFDFETSVSKDCTLRKQTLLGYLDKCEVLGFACAFGDEEPEWIPASGIENVRDDIEAACLDPDTTWVAHNAAFDVRVLTKKLGFSHPQRVLCSLELCCAAFPNQPGGYSLAALGKFMHMQHQKSGDGSKVMKMTADELASYCINDTKMCREVAQECLRRLDPREVEIAVLANQARELTFQIKAGAVQEASEAFSQIAADAAMSAITNLGADGSDAFGWDGKTARSVKPAALKTLLLENLGFDTPTISLKKINPEKLRANTDAAGVLQAAATANKAMSQNRRVKTFAGATEVTCELGYFRAHTGRYSSPSVGKGLNLHNLNKRDPKVSKAIRSIFRLPEDLCFVRADEANVEYRVEGLLTGCEHTAKLFMGDVMADPYAAFWFACTGQRVTKKDPARQVAKAAVLGLGFMMGVQTWIFTLMQALADPTMKVSLQDLEKIVADMGWRYPTDKFVRAAQTKLHAPDAVCVVAYHTRELFHKLHPEFRRLAFWLEQTVARLAACRSKQAAQFVLDNAYRSASAPPIHQLQLHWTAEFEGSTVRVTCGPHWQPTVTWRDLAIRPFPNGGAGLTYMAGNKGYRPVTKNLLIENVTQAAARNATVQAKRILSREYGYRHILSVHDELLLAVHRTTQAVCKARHDLLAVMGPQGRLSDDWGWSVIINPDEISVSQSLYEVQQSAEWWAALPITPAQLEALP
jgi:hypothetical protein